MRDARGGRDVLDLTGGAVAGFHAKPGVEARGLTVGHALDISPIVVDLVHVLVSADSVMLVAADPDG